jgi:hypothetical protein
MPVMICCDLRARCSELVDLLVGPDDGVGAGDGVAAGAPVVVAAAVPVRVPVRAAEDAAAPALEPHQPHLPAARRAPAALPLPHLLIRRCRCRRLGTRRRRGRRRRGGERVRRGRGHRSRLGLGAAEAVPEALGAEVARGRGAEEAAVVGAGERLLRVLAPLLLHRFGRCGGGWELGGACLRVGAWASGRGFGGGRAPPTRPGAGGFGKVDSDGRVVWWRLPEPREVGGGYVFCTLRGNATAGGESSAGDFAV